MSPQCFLEQFGLLPAPFHNSFWSPSSHALVVPLSVPPCHQIIILVEMYNTEKAAVQKDSNYISYCFSTVSVF